MSDGKAIPDLSLSRSQKRRWRLRTEQEAEVQREDDCPGSAAGTGAAASGLFLTPAPCRLLGPCLAWPCKEAVARVSRHRVTRSDSPGVYTMTAPCVDGSARLLLRRESRGGSGACSAGDTHTQALLTQAPHVPSDARSQKRPWHQAGTTQAFSAEWLLL